jgi:hypothetical protein
VLDWRSYGQDRYVRRMKRTQGAAALSSRSGFENA